MTRKRQRGRNPPSPAPASSSRRSLSSGARPSTASVYYDRFAERALQALETAKGKKPASVERGKRHSGGRNQSGSMEKRPNSAIAIVTKPKRARAPIPPPTSFQNIVLYLNKEGQVITREAVEDISGLPLAKRRKRNVAMEDDILASCVLLDPVTLEEEEVWTRNFHLGVFMPKGMLTYKEENAGFRVANICANPSLKAVCVSLAKKAASPLIVVDKKRIVATVLYTERQKVAVKWNRQQVLLSQWDVFQLDEGQEFILANLSEKTVARVQIYEIC